MRTPILYGKDGALRRAVWGVDRQPGLTGYESPKFSSAFVSTGVSFPSLRPTSTKYGDGVWLNPWRFGIARGAVKAGRDGATAVTIDEEYVEQLDRLDEEIQAMVMKRRALMDEAFRRGKPLKVADVIARSKPAQEKGTDHAV